MNRVPGRASLGRTASAWLIVLTGLLAAQAFTALAGIVLARRVDAVDYGQYLASVSLAAILVALVNLGMDQWLLAYGTDSPTKLMRAFHGALRIRLPLLALWLVGVTLLGSLLPPDAFPQPYLLLAALAIGCDSVTLLSYSVLRNVDRHRAVTSFQGAAAFCLLIASLVLPLAPGEASRFLTARATISVTTAILSVIYVRKRISSLQPMTPEPAIATLRSTLPFMWSELAVAVYMRADLSVLSLVKGPTAASIYGPAISLLSMCFLVPGALYLLVVPDLAHRYKQSSHRFRRLAVFQLFAQALSGVVLFAGVFAFAPWLIQTVLGPDYAASAGTLSLLSPILLFKSLSFGLGAWLTASGKQAVRTQIQIIVAVLNLCANLAVVTRFGINGVAMVYVISEALLFVSYGIAVKKGHDRQARLKIYENTDC